jgi:hypothetical protein
MIFQLMQHFQWTFVSVAHSDDEEGNEVYAQLMHLFAQDNDPVTCLPDPIKLSPGLISKKDVSSFVQICPVTFCSRSDLPAFVEINLPALQGQDFGFRFSVSVRVRVRPRPTLGTLQASGRIGPWE